MKIKISKKFLKEKHNQGREIDWDIKILAAQFGSRVEFWLGKGQTGRSFDWKKNK